MFDISHAENPLNIKSMVLPPVKLNSGLTFHPERDLRSDDFDIIRQSLLSEDPAEAKFKSGYIDFLFRLKYLYPQRQADLKMNELDDQTWQALSPRLNEEVEHSNWYGYLQDLAYMKLLFPAKYMNTNFSIFERVCDFVDNLRQTGNNIVFPLTAMHFKMAFPTSMTELSLDDPLFQKLNDAYLKMQDDGLDSVHIPANGPALKIIFPQHAQEVIYLPETWKGLRTILDKRRLEKEWKGFSYNALCMYMMAADELKVDQDGLTITYRKSLGSLAQNQPVPQIRRF